MPSLTEKQARLIRKAQLTLVLVWGPIWIGGGTAYVFRHETAADVIGVAGSVAIVATMLYFIRALYKTGPPFDTFRGFWPWWPFRR